MINFVSMMEMTLQHRMHTISLVDTLRVISLAVETSSLCRLSPIVTELETASRSCIRRVFLFQVRKVSVFTYILNNVVI